MKSFALLILAYILSTARSGFTPPHFLLGAPACIRYPTE